MKTRCKLTVFFESPFWVGIFERIEDEQLTVSKITFGSEPKDNEIYDFIIHRFHTLRFSSPVDVKEKKKVINPKRRIRLVKKQMKNAGVGTKSQMALKKQFEENKLQHRKEKKKLTHIKKQHQFELKKLKKKQKHKGH